jgi:hypothetical protein
MHLITDTWQSNFKASEMAWMARRQGKQEGASGRKCLWPTRMIDLER